jgi:hypothetical protein
VTRAAVEDGAVRVASSNAAWRWCNPMRERAIPRACGFAAATRELAGAFNRTSDVRMLFGHPRESGGPGKSRRRQIPAFVGYMFSLGSPGVGWHRQTRLTVRLRGRLSVRNPTGKQVCPCHPRRCPSRLNRYRAGAGMTRGSALPPCHGVARLRGCRRRERNRQCLM